MSSRARTQLRRAVDGLLGRAGYTIVRQPGRDRVYGVATGGRLEGFDPGLHSSASSLPPGAEEVLREDNPRLAELRESYARLDWPVCSHSRWRPVNVSGFLSLQYFRGDTVYLWHYRDSEELAQLKYFVYLRYLTERDGPRLLERLDEDGAFGCWTYRFPPDTTVSRDLLDSVNELLFLERHLSILHAEGLRILDIGAGYGRLAHRASQAIESLSLYACADAVPESTFLSEYYTSFRSVTPPVRVVPLPEVPALPTGGFDLAVNVHSFSECPVAAIEWWMQLLARLEVPRLFLVPNERTGFLSTEPDATRRDYLPVIEAAGYRCRVEEWAFDDPAVRQAIGIGDRFCLFEREA
ncbi:MAG TPA: putative sugar O-methyltransferase [Acidimicrobiales bacterium]|nr:putative sugar O-methyltransferase [Acidimicrobiales bacterium]